MCKWHKNGLDCKSTDQIAKFPHRVRRSTCLQIYMTKRRRFALWKFWRFQKLCRCGAEASIRLIVTDRCPRLLMTGRIILIQLPTPWNHRLVGLDKAAVPLMQVFHFAQTGYWSQMSSESVTIRLTQEDPCDRKWMHTLSLNTQPSTNIHLRTRNFLNSTSFCMMSKLVGSGSPINQHYFVLTSWS